VFPLCNLLIKCFNTIPSTTLDKLFVKYDNIDIGDGGRENDDTENAPLSWIKAALKEFERFPEGARSICWPR